MCQDGWLKIDYSDAGIFVRLSGRLDRTLRNTIRPTLGKLLNNEIRDAICLKMDDVFFLDSSTAVALIGFVKDAYRCNASPSVIRFLRACHHPDRDNAFSNNRLTFPCRRESSERIVSDQVSG
ncbi:MAG: hypothetical protein OXT74_16600 [Candidatus Poribacteria bacterium]|nr:hypothetical protein [Candidatus Poribacteria bacterium]